MFPFKIAGVKVATAPTGVPDVPDSASSPVCICPIDVPPFFKIGIPVAFWEPARLIEVVKDPFCFPTLGVGLSPANPGTLGGGTTHSGQSQESITSFYQAHYFIYPIWSMLEILTDFVCLEHSGFDLAYLTEVDPTWNDDLLAMTIYPETLLFGNLPAQLSCTADSVASNIGLPLSPLYWCIGSGGSAYPMTGHVKDDKLVQASLSVALRMIYKMARVGSICDTGLWVCSCVPTPIWVKHDYRLNIAKPVTGHQCIAPGRSSLIWGVGKNPPLPAGGDSPDNYLYVLFRKRVCCAF